MPLPTGRGFHRIIKPCLPGGVAPIKTRRPRPPSSVASLRHSAQPGGIPTGLGRNKCVWLCSKLLPPRGTDAVYKYLPRNSSADLLFR